MMAVILREAAIDLTCVFQVSTEANFVCVCLCVWGPFAVGERLAGQVTALPEAWQRGEGTVSRPG